MRTVTALTIVAVLLPYARVGAASRARGEGAPHTPAASSTIALPPVMVSVYAAPHIPASTIARMLAETADVWRPNGVTFVWMRGPEEVAPYGRDGGTRYRPSTLRVTIDRERGGHTADGQTPLGWILFDRPDEPDQEIHVSYANAEALLDASAAVVGSVSTMPRLERELYIARALGRALAHELGHYLLASKAHTERGLMQTNRSAGEFFGRQRVHFELDETQKQRAVSRLAQTMLLSRR